jgi:hypothetical protein
MQTHYTYAHTKPDGTIFYIGKGIGRRAYSKNRNDHWKRIVSKYGYEVQILAHWDTEAEALDHEVLLISCMKDMGIELANMTDGGEGATGYQHTEESKAKISKVRKGKIVLARRVLTVEQVLEIRPRIGYRNIAQLAREYVVGESTIRRIRDGERYGEVR